MKQEAVATVLQLAAAATVPQVAVDLNQHVLVESGP
jgi:hypothetical protein